PGIISTVAVEKFGRNKLTRSPAKKIADGYKLISGLGKIWQRLGHDGIPSGKGRYSTQFNNPDLGFRAAARRAKLRTDLSPCGPGSRHPDRESLHERTICKHYHQHR